jgi:hypothetical protein
MLVAIVKANAGITTLKSKNVIDGNNFYSEK